MYRIQILILSLFVILLSSCGPASKKDSASADSTAFFTLLSPDKTHVHFANTLTEGLNTNVLMYEYFYNGGGVAIGDVNNDGKQDIYFTGNMTGNKLYLNKGKMQFEDITAMAGVAGRPGPWKTGVTMADVNGDGRLDIYVCYSGNLPVEKRTNQLFINEGNNDKGIPHFSEQAQKYGLADPAYTTQAYFFDYDRDGDLDLLLLNHNPNSLPILDEAHTAALLKKTDTLTSTRLFENDKGYFTDKTRQAGLNGSPLSYGLGAGIGDINRDGWQDIYICNDYSIPDYLYINDHDGTFTDRLKEWMGHTSEFSMGNDIADINNDALPDIYTLDMLPEDNHRQKLLFAPDNYAKFNLMVRNGFYYQYMRNMLHINNGNGTFSEIGQAAGISNTDWSWAPLFADYNNDGWKDLFVTNGYLRDFTNMDFMKYMNDYIQSKGRLKRKDVLELVEHIPSSHVTNYLFRNNGGVAFTNVSEKWGLDLPSNSNGAAYADLDNDGDLDLVVNNINRSAFIFQNEASKQTKNHYLEIKLNGAEKNTQGIGAKVIIYNKDKLQYQEQMPSRGYQSSITPVLHFGLGPNKSIDSLRIIWLSGKQQILTNVKADQSLTLKEKNATKKYISPTSIDPYFEEIKSPIAYQNIENNINDFKRQPLMVNPMSFFGPCMAKGDVNGDGLDDIYVGGGSGQSGVIFLQQKNGKFLKKGEAAFEQDKMSSDADAVFFDANHNGTLDLYVCSGGYNDFQPDDKLLQDRLYFNDGQGNFTKNDHALPVMHTSTGCVRAADINGDSYPDLFVGGRVVPGQYPKTPDSYVLINDQHGHFKDMTKTISPQLQKPGMVTDAAWVNINNDEKKDLVVVGEWMPVSIFINIGGKLENKSSDYFDKKYNGWWNKLLVDDLNKDGKPDLVIGNYGLNTQCKVSDKEPASLHYKDFDHNGSIDPVFCFYIQNKSYPCVTRDELFGQMSAMRTRFPSYESYADATLTDIFTEEELKGTKRLQANFLKTAYFESNDQGKFQLKSLPIEAQFSPVFTITAIDYNGDKNKDLLLCGNISQTRLRFGKSDANYGALLEGDGKGNFTYVPQRRSGFHLRGDVRSVVVINQILLFGVNQKRMKAYQLQ